MAFLFLDYSFFFVCFLSKLSCCSEIDMQLSPAVEAVVDIMSGTAGLKLQGPFLTSHLFTDYGSR